MFSKDTPFEHVLAGVPAALRMALKERSLDQPGVLVAFIQDVLEEGMAAGIFVDTGIPTISVVGSDPINSFSPPSSSSLSHTVPSTSSPLLPPVSHESSIPGKQVVKTIRSRKGGKVRAVKKELMEGTVEERGELEKEVVDVGGGKGRVADSGVLSTGGRVAECFPEVPGSPANLDVQNTIRTPTESVDCPHFHGLSQNSESCGVPARLKTSELSAHQMPKILHAERSSNASSASGLGGSTLDPWEQASRKSYRSLLDGGLLPSGHEDMFVKLAQKARPAEKRIKKRISAMSPLEFGQELREAEKARLQAEEVRRQPEQLIHSSQVPKKARKAGHDDFLRSMLVRTQKGQRRAVGWHISQHSSLAQTLLSDAGSSRNQQRATAWVLASDLEHCATVYTHCVGTSPGLLRLILFRSRVSKSMCWTTWNSRFRSRAHGSR